MFRNGFCSDCKTSSGQRLRGTDLCVDCALQIAGKLAGDENVPADQLARVLLRNNSAVEQVAHLINHERARRSAAATTATPIVTDPSPGGLCYKEAH